MSAGEPASPWEVLQREIQRWLEGVAPQEGSGHGTVRPAVDLGERGDEIVVHVDLPGADPDAIDLQLAGNVLSLHARRDVDDRREWDDVLRCERSAGFREAIPMPAPVDPETMTAECRDGVLTVRVRKRESTAGRSVPVQHPGEESDTGS